MSLLHRLHEKEMLELEIPGYGAFPSGVCCFLLDGVARVESCTYTEHIRAKYWINVGGLERPTITNNVVDSASLSEVERSFSVVKSRIALTRDLHCA